jgi:glycerol-3-phosphate acyltransferase PlsX
MKIALDAMGGDHAPSVPVQGALAAVDEFGDELRVILVGPEGRLRSELERQRRATESRIEIADASDVVSMHDSAGRAVRDKRDSSLLRAIELHKEGAADAVVSAGHTGAQMAASYLMLGLIEGVRRPTIGGLFPVGDGRFCVLLDVGANIDCKPKHLLQFAIMGSVFMEIMTGSANPRVGLLSIGEEKTKGNEQVQDTHYLLEESGLNFVGNLEGGDVMAGKAEVVVCDGFVGNILLKFAESLGALLLSRVKNLRADDSRLAEGMKQIQKEFDYAEIGGVPLLGINGISIVCHGRSSPKAIKSAIREAMTLRQGNLPEALTRGVTRYEVGMMSRGLARLKSFRERHHESEGTDPNDD